MTPEEEHETLIRLDENVTAMMKSLDRGIEKFDRIDSRLSNLELVTAKHEKYMAEHPGICSDLSDLKESFIKHDTMERGRAKGIGTLAVVLVGVINLIVLILPYFRGAP